MKFALQMFPTDYAIPAHELAKAAEDLGFEALFFPEHTHIPVEHTPFPGGGELPLQYSHTLDPFAVIGACAVVTSTIKLGTGICLVIQRDPIMLAKEVASVDLLSNGRFLFGIGGGWNLPEIANHGVKPTTRWKVMRERIFAMKEIWANDVAEYHGSYVDFDPIWSWPKPVQKPHPPILVGGNGPRTFERVLEFGDEWMPTGIRNVEYLKQRMAELKETAAGAGRAGDIPVSVFGASPKAEDLNALREAGVSRAVLSMPSVATPEALDRLKGYAATIKSL